VKTISLKKVAVVAVASLGFGLLSVVPVNAAVGTATAPYISDDTTVDADGASGAYSAVALDSITSTTAPGVAATAGIVTNSVTAITVPSASAVVFKVAASTGTFGTNDLHDLVINGQFISSTAGTDATTNSLSSWTAPTVTATTVYNGTITTYQTGSTRAASTLTVVNNIVITVVGATAAVASLDAAKSNISIMLQSDHATCAAAGSAAHKTAVAAVAKTSGYYISGNASSAFTICVSTRNGLDAAVTPASIFITTTKGLVKDANDATVGTAPGVAATPGAGVTKTNLSGDSVQTGPTTVTAVVTYGTSVISLTTSFTWYGKLASLELANNAYAGSIAAGNTADAITIVAKDSTGNKIPYTAWTDAAATGKVTTSITDASAADLKLESSKGNGATVTTKGQSNAYATVVTAGADATTGQTSNGSIDVDCTALSPESIKVTLYGYSSVSAAAGATDPQTIVSNTVTYVCSSATAATVTVKPTTTSVAAGKSTTVDVVVLDANGLIVPDGTAIALATNGGHSVIGASTTTTNGGLYTKGTFVAGGSGGTATITAVAGDASGIGTLSVTGTTGSTIETQIDALNAKIVALNALIAKIMKKLGVK